ncbi:MAG TPA: isoleucine--tRNA ligase [Gemmatimonadaceae bacterium]|nr:isoleucine--tRNA ligase [Gemmatimonadaceae bacterium]
MITAEQTDLRFRPLPPEMPADELEQEVLRRWRDEDLLREVARAAAGREEFVFFEGPPTANGKPGIHHVFSRTIKDLFCRHRAMRGYHITRKAGWDTHGLPVEIEVERMLGISGKQQIEEIGVEEFNRLCRESVWKYKGDWERLSERIGYALDYSDPYITYSNEYIESVWWALKTLHERDLLYRGHKILPYCPRCGTSLSSHEVAQGYKDVKDPSVYVALEVRDAELPALDSLSPAGSSLSASSASRAPRPASRVLVWTTTPWTLVSNAALAVNPELVYVEVARRERDEPALILAEARVQAVLGDDFADRWEVVSRRTGRELAGLRYRRPLDWVPYAEGEHEIIVAESFVSADDGTGVVHLAPAFGADDYAAGQRHSLSFLQPVNARGEFPAEVPVVGGAFVKDADPLIVKELERRGSLFRAGRVEHAYPHCWRCDTPLLYYARESWFVRTTSFRDQMLARNARVHWQPPEAGKGRFGEWLINNIDWALSRDRYWGTPLPVWVCDADDRHVQAVGGYADLAMHLGRALPDDFDPHKPFIDRYVWPCVNVNCRGTMRRVSEVIDTWFDSGSMPFAQWHFPFEQRDVMRRHYPADFIAEGIDQTRGWFYSLLAIATGLGDALPNNDVGGWRGDGGQVAGEQGASENDQGREARSPFDTAPYRNVVVNDLVLDANGVKMSKRLGNIVDPWEVVERHGADAVRLFLMTSSQVWVPRKFDEDAIRETAGRFLMTLKNVYSGMFAQYANYGWTPSTEDPPPAERRPVDRWVLSRLTSVEREMNELLDAYEATAAGNLLVKFVVDDVSNWYVRLNRPRLYDVDTADNRAAFATLHEVLVVVSRLLAPLCPFVSDWMHRELTGASVHLAPYVRDGSLVTEPALELAMGQVRTLATLGRAAREDANVKVRQPLSRLVCVVPNSKAELLQDVLYLLALELNVKQVEFVSSGSGLVRLEAKPNFRSLGKRFGKATPLAAEAVAALSSEALAAFEQGEPVAISVNGESHLLTPEDLTVVRRASGALVVKEEGGYLAAIDPTITPELRQEGLARELVSRVQRLRKEAGLAVSDRIRLHVAGNEAVEAMVREYRDYVAAEVLAADISVGGDPAWTPHAAQSVDLDGLTARVALTRVP